MYLSFSNLITLICSVLLTIHIIGGAFWFLKKTKKINLVTGLMTVLISAEIILIFLSCRDLSLWFLCLANILLGTTACYLYYKNIVAEEYLKEYINFKLYIELTGIIYSLLGVVLSKNFKSYENIFAFITLIIFLRLNWIIFFKKRVYSLNFSYPEISSNPLISLVIVALNEEKYISNLLTSIKKQSYHKTEIIFVDDASTDKTVEVVRSFQADLPIQIIVKKKSDRGVSRSRNLGAKSAQGELILFLDSDVVLPADFIEKIVDEFLDKNLAIAAADFEPYETLPKDRAVITIYRHWLNFVQYFFPRAVGFCMMVRRDTHDKILFDEEVIQAEDFDYVRRGSCIGKFRILKSTSIKVSWRRFRNENAFVLTLKYLAFEIYRNTFGEIKSQILPYNFEDNHK